MGQRRRDSDVSSLFLFPVSAGGVRAAESTNKSSSLFRSTAGTESRIISTKKLSQQNAWMSSDNGVSFFLFSWSFILVLKSTVDPMYSFIVSRQARVVVYFCVQSCAPSLLNRGPLLWRGLFVVKCALV